MALFALVLILGFLVAISGSTQLMGPGLILGLLVIIAGHIALELSERDLIKRRLAAYERLKNVVRRLHLSGTVSKVDADGFAEAMLDIRFLFDESLERFVSGIFEILLKKQELDTLLKKATCRENACADQALINKAQRKSRQLTNQICNGIYRELPAHMEKFIRCRLVSSLPGSASPPALPSRPELSRNL
jgi:hypothetical protein